MDIFLTDSSLNLIIFSVLSFQLLATVVLWINRHIDPDSKAIFTVFLWIFPGLGAFCILVYLLQQKILRKRGIFVRNN